jgi:apolipoprotein N-acyltransferase
MTRDIMRFVKTLGRVNDRRKSSKMSEVVRVRPESLASVRVGRSLLVAAAVGASALALTCAQPPMGLWWIGGLALVPWLAAARSPAALVAGGLAWGTVSGIALGSWIYGGLRNVGADPLLAMVGLVSIAFAVTGIPGALYGAAAVAARRVRAGPSVVFALGVAAIDSLRAVPHLGLPWSLLGHTQAPAAGVVQLAVVGGVPAISALLAGLAYSLAERLASGPDRTLPWTGRPSWPAWLGAYLALLLLGLPVARALRPDPADDAPRRRLLAIQHRISPGARWHAGSQEGNLAAIARRTLAAIDGQDRPPDLVLWPETTLTVALEESPRVASALRSWISRLGAPVVLGGVSAVGSHSRYRNSAIWLDARGAIRDRFDKTLAVPLVERAPSTRIEELLQHMLGADAIERLVIEGSEQRSLRGDDRYAVALCYEILYPGLVSARTEPDTLAILNLANDAWYGSDTPGRQQLAFATFRAIERRRHLVRVADSGPSAIIDPYGRIVNQRGPATMGAIPAEITSTGGPRRSEQTAILAVGTSGAILGLGAREAARSRSRNRDRSQPPPRIRTCGITASGSCLG